MRLSLLFVSLLGGAALAAPPPPKKAPPAKTPAKPAPPAKKKPPVVVSAEHKKQLSELMAGFKFGMSHDEVTKIIVKRIEDSHADELKAAAGDVAAQDRIRKTIKSEVANLAGKYTKFEAKTTGYDVSMVDDEFAHNTGESMLDYWPTDHPRTFFFFKDDKLWKELVLFDLTKFPEDKRNFDTMRAALESDSKFGPGDFDNGVLSWGAGEFTVRTIDKLHMYSMLALAIEEPATKKEVIALREEKAPKQKEGTSIINSVIDKDGTDHPDVKQNNNAVDTVIKANGGGGKKPAPAPTK